MEESNQILTQSLIWESVKNVLNARGYDVGIITNLYEIQIMVDGIMIPKTYVVHQKDGLEVVLEIDDNYYELMQEAAGQAK